MPKATENYACKGCEWVMCVDDVLVRLKLSSSSHGIIFHLKLSDFHRSTRDYKREKCPSDPEIKKSSNERFTEWNETDKVSQHAVYLNGDGRTEDRLARMGRGVVEQVQQTPIVVLVALRTDVRSVLGRHHATVEVLQAPRAHLALPHFLQERKLLVHRLHLVERVGLNQTRLQALILLRQHRQLLLQLRHHQVLVHVLQLRFLELRHDLQQLVVFGAVAAAARLEAAVMRERIERVDRLDAGEVVRVVHERKLRRRVLSAAGE